MCRVEVVDVREDKPIVKLRTVCEKEDGTVVADGEAVLKLPSAASR